MSEKRIVYGEHLSRPFIQCIDALKERLLAEKKKGWVKKWQKVEPYVKHFPLGFILGFIRNLIILAIKRQFEV